ncbi:MAG TPA: hypothetical protein VNY10_06360 [Roseiarcus sp.]|nr:hypothetical protein [Roseiarcus sp.]
MTWYVKKKGADGAVSATLVDIWAKAIEMRADFETKGFKAWIEDIEGRRVGFTEITPAAKKS